MTNETDKWKKETQDSTLFGLANLPCWVPWNIGVWMFHHKNMNYMYLNGVEVSSDDRALWVHDCTNSSSEKIQVADSGEVDEIMYERIGLHVPWMCLASPDESKDVFMERRKTSPRAEVSQ